jgi:phenylalanyl-tRNA synthetase beta chain
MKFSYNWLQSFFKEKLPQPAKLAELLNMKAFEVESFEKSGHDWILNIDVLPNRAPDCFSHLGIAREIAAITNSKLKTQNSKPQLKIQNFKAKDFISVEVKDKNACPRYTAKVFADVKVSPSPKWMQERLEVCGLQAINNIVDITNYVMLETGQPLHAFDGEKLAGKKIVVRFAREGEKITTLDEEKYELDKNILVIADEKRPVGIAGIKGGKGSEISKSTKIVVLESANFNPQVIRRGSKAIDLKTDASLRFEHGISPNLTEKAINRAVLLMEEMTGGKIAQGLVDIYPKKVWPKKIFLELDYAEKLLGTKLSKKQVSEVFRRLGFKAFKSGAVEVPTIRLDVVRQEDLIEELGRMLGYEKISAVSPLVSLVPPKRNLDIFWENLSKDILRAAGFTEAYNYSFVSEKDNEIFGSGQLLELENPTSEDFKYLRPSLIINLLKNVVKNQRNFPQIKIFELGKIFRKPRVEKRMLTGLITGDAFYQTKGVVDLLLQKLGMSNVWFDEYTPTPEESKMSIWHPQRCAEIKIDNLEIGFLGEISEKILQDLKIKNKATSHSELSSTTGVVAFDLDFEKLVQVASEEHEYRPLSRFPAAVRDIAVLVPLETRVEQVLNEIETAAGSLIRDIDLFDIYEGEELPDSKKNLAFHIIYQAEDRTLTSTEIEVLQNKIVKTLEKNPLWEVRK